MLLTLIVFLLILSVLVTVHELGHFLIAKKFGIFVEEFGFGLPPRMFGIKRGETLYSVNWLPIGGFVKLYGEEGDIKEAKNRNIPKNRAFYARPVSQRVMVIAAGVVMNFVLALTVVSYIFTQGVMVPTDRVHIEKIVENSPAGTAGLKSGDIIKTIIAEGVEKDIKTGDDLIKTTSDNLGKEITLIIERQSREQEISIIPRQDYPLDQGPMGVVISVFEEKKYSIEEAPIAGLKQSLVLSWELVKGIGLTVWKLATFQSVSKDVAGPIGIAQMTGEAIRFGRNAVLEMLGLLSLNLAIVNILPFPALDGGRLLFVVIEGITGKRIKTNWERHIHQAGMAVLLLLILLVTLNDLIRIFSK